MLAAEHGLFGGGVRATYGSPTGTPGVIRVASTAGISYNSGFNDTQGSDSSLVANADYAQFTALSDGVAGVTGSNQQVLLGSFTFQVQGAVGDSTVLTAATVPTLSDTVTFDNSYELDPLISPRALTVTVVPVPEPGHVLAFGAAAASGPGLPEAAWPVTRGEHRRCRWRYTSAFSSRIGTKKSANGVSGVAVPRGIGHPSFVACSGAWSGTTSAAPASAGAEPPSPTARTAAGQGRCSTPG